MSQATNYALRITRAAGFAWLDFLRDVGRHFSVNRMLTMDSVRLRLEREQEMSFIEFNYMVCQAYDFVELSRRANCRLQMGGSDQWGNIVNGVDLGRRMGTPQLFALTTPLLTTASGDKMGKTARGASSTSSTAVGTRGNDIAAIFSRDEVFSFGGSLVRNRN